MPEEEVEKPLNTRLRDKLPSDIIKLVPRRYQAELCQKALQKNVIIYLGTGLGKTFITVMYLTHPTVDELIQNGKRIVFLAPTQDLIKQQAEYINKQVRYRIKVFCGRNAHCGEHIDMWSKKIWSLELEKIDLLFMTPQIFASAISTNLLDWSQFAVIIFDEVHHACRTSKLKESGHPYNQIISHYNDYYRIRASMERPRIIGLTASLINSMPKDRDSIRGQVSYIEKIFHANCITDISVQDIRPKMVIHSYFATQLNKFNDLLILMFSECASKFKQALKTDEVKRILSMKSHLLTKEQERTAAYYNRLKLASAGFSIKPGSFPKVLDGLDKVRERCGLWALSAICSRLILALEKHDRNASLREDLKCIYNEFTNMMRILKAHLDEFLNQDSLEGLLKFTRPKCKTLLDMLMSEYKRTLDTADNKESFSCIIFIRSRLEVLALNLWLQQVSSRLTEYSFIKPDYAIGIAATMSSKYSCITKRKPSEQYKMLTNFRNGLLNVIVTTSVLEEGIDLPTCSTVIRYDEPNTFREYVQSRGRARQRVSTFMSLVEETNIIKNKSKLDKFNDFESTLKDYLNNTDSNLGNIPRAVSTYVPAPEEIEDRLLYDDNRINISATTAKTLLNMYLQSLARKTPFTDGITYERLQPSLSTFQTILYLPSGCPLNSATGIMGNIKTTPLGADNSAIVAAVKALMEAKELDEKGLPARISEEKIDTLLEQLNLKPNFELLEKQIDCTDKIRSEDGFERFSYEPKMAQTCDYLSKNYSQRRYKLLRLTFVAQETPTLRMETRKYFEKSIFGIIVDSATPNDFIKKNLFTHYGQFEVKYEQVSDNLTISNHHDIYLNYTHNLLHKCLSIRTRRSEFKYRCQFYIVILNSNNEPNFNKMQHSFTNSRRIRVNDIVKVRYIFSPSRNSFDNKLYLVRSINDRNFRITNDRARRAFEEKSDSLHPYSVVEVMPLSKEFARSKVMKSKSRFYKTDSIYLREPELELLEEDPSIVFQAYNLPEQIYNLYSTISILDLERNFLKHSEGSEIKLIEPPKEPTELNIEADAHSLIERLSFAGDEDDAEDLVPMELDNDDEHSISSNDTIYTDDEDGDEEILIGKEYKDLIGKNILDLNDNNNEETFQRWDMSKYEEKNLKVMDYEYKRTHDLAWLEEGAAYQAETFNTLRTYVSSLTNSLCQLLMEFKETMTSDNTFLNEDEEFRKRESVVDHEIKSEIIFDKIKPYKEASTIKSLLEALTQRRAQESYNLEGLENIGDSYIKYVTTVVLFQSVDGNEGYLTSARSRLTCNEHFTLLARIKKLGSYAITRGFSKDLLFHILGQQSSARQSDNNLVNLMKPKQLADLIESIVGSFLIYHGQYNAVKAIEWLGLNIFKKSTFEELHEHSVVFARSPTSLIDSEESKQYYRACRRKMTKFEDIIGYKFQDSSYLVQAFTHASSAQKCTRSYERLEFLGDSILDFLVTMHLVIIGSIETPGQITASRSALVNNVAFARLSIKYKFDLFLQHGSSDLYDELSRLRLELDEDPEMANLDMVDFDKIVKLLGDLFESVAAAIYLDSGNSLDRVWSVYYPMMKQSIDQELDKPTKNMISLLNETFPGSGRISYEYNFKNDDTSLVECECTIAGFGKFRGKGLSRKQAKLRAIQDAMRNPPSEEVKKRLDRDHQNQLFNSSRGGARNVGGKSHSGGRTHSGGRNRQQNSQSTDRNSYKSRRRY